MTNGKWAMTIGAAVVMLATAAGVQAWSDRTNHLTFSRSVALPGVVLAQGTYTFEIATTQGGIDVVRVSSRDGQRVFYQGFTQVVLRPAGLAREQMVTFGEATPGQAPPIDAWFPIGSETGRRFQYR